MRELIKTNKNVFRDECLLMMEYIFYLGSDYSLMVSISIKLTPITFNNAFKERYSDFSSA